MSKFQILLLVVAGLTILLGLFVVENYEYKKVDSGKVLGAGNKIHLQK